MITDAEFIARAAHTPDSGDLDKLARITAATPAVFAAALWRPGRHADAQDDLARVVRKILKVAA